DRPGLVRPRGAPLLGDGEATGRGALFLRSNRFGLLRASRGAVASGGIPVPPWNSRRLGRRKRGTLPWGAGTFVAAFLPLHRSMDGAAVDAARGHRRRRSLEGTAARSDLLPVPGLAVRRLRDPFRERGEA